jgi:hypothetical protein
MSHQVSPSLIKIRLLPVIGGGNPQFRALIMDDAEGVFLAPGMDLSSTPWDVARECGYAAELVARPARRLLLLVRGDSCRARQGTLAFVGQRELLVCRWKMASGWR